MIDNRLFYGRQFVDLKDKIALKDSLNQRLISGGKLIDEFEKWYGRIALNIFIFKFE